jgi:hypothetical protein
MVICNQYSTTDGWTNVPIYGFHIIINLCSILTFVILNKYRTNKIKRLFVFSPTYPQDGSSWRLSRLDHSPQAKKIKDLSHEILGVLLEKVTKYVQAKKNLFLQTG